MTTVSGYLRFIAIAATLVWSVSAIAQPAAPNLGASAQKSPSLEKKVVLIGGKKSHGPGEHDFPNGIPLIAAWLKASPAFASTDVLAYTTGWPADLAALDGASAIVLYFDGVGEKPVPLLDPERIKHMQKLVDAGTGLITIHQASTVPPGNTTIPLVDWLGAKRNGMYDRTTERVTISPVSQDHPISFGVGEFTVKDEWYPTLLFAERNVTPILRGAVTPKYGNKARQASDPPQKGEHVLAWAYERPNGGRSFGYTGGHYLKSLDDPAVRKMIINAIAWTSHINVPATGIYTPEPIVGKSVVNKHEQNDVHDMPWGELRWYTSAAMDNSRVMTTGVAILRPGKSNPVHYHPNCDEILTVVSGKIQHTMNEVSVEMSAGDTVSIPQGVLHNATNTGDEDAILAISFNTAFRGAVGY